MKTFSKIIYFLVPIIAVALSYLPWTSGFWSNVPSNEILVNLVSTYFILLGGILIFDLKETKSDILGEIKEASQFIKQNTRCEFLSDSKFYSHFSHEARQAESNVNICYFAPYPPDSTNHKERKKYYEEIISTIKKKPEVKFRRIIRNTPANKEWIKEIISEFKNVPNFDLRIINDCPDDNIKMPHALSVQIIDTRKCWLVAIESHEKEGPFRDLYIEGDEIGKSLTGYFNRLWSMSDEIISSGRLTGRGITFENG